MVSPGVKEMVFQSLLSTVTSASSSSSGFIGGGLGGSPPENGGVLCGGLSKDSPGKHYLVGSVRTFNDIPQAERSNRRPPSMRPDHGARSATGKDGSDAAAAPTFGWWSWRKVEEGSGDAAAGREGGATLFAMEKSLTSWEQDANEKLNDWQHAEEIVPLFRSSVAARSSCNYGTFARRDFLYSGAAACAPSSVTTQMASSLVERAECGKSDSSSSTSSRSNEERHGTAQTSSAAGSASTQVASFIEHMLRPGDTLSALAVKYQVHVNDITRANGISGMGSHTSLLVRKSLRIPVLSFAVQFAGGEDTAAALPAEDDGTQDSKAEAKPSKEERRAAKGGRKRSEKAGERDWEGKKERAGGENSSYQSPVTTRIGGGVDPIAARLQAVAAAATAAAAAHTPQ